MRLYTLLDRIFPNSFPAKVFFVAFIGTHIPLIAVVGWVLGAQAEIGLLHPVVGVLLAATLFGTLVTLSAVWSLLAPLRRLREAIEAFEKDGVLPVDLPRGRDDIGRVTRSALRMARRLSSQMQERVGEAETDALTGLLNRRGLDARAANIEDGALMFIDLDGFKAVNDSLGHETGDRVLTAVASCLRAETRSADILARYGGDEFVMILPETTNEGAALIGERLRDAIGGVMHPGQAQVTGTIGIASIEGDWRCSLERADRAMLDGKGDGRNRVRIWRECVSVPGKSDTDFAEATLANRVR